MAPPNEEPFAVRLPLVCRDHGGSIKSHHVSKQAAERSHSSLSPSPTLESHIMADNEGGAVYYTVDKPKCVGGAEEDEEDREHDYTSIAEMNGMVPASSSSDLYATVRDIYSRAACGGPRDDEEGEDADPASESTEPCYETIGVPKATAAEPPGGEERGAGGGGGSGLMEPDYEELGMGRETSRL
ncbi:hypothetical protein CRUP_037896 [Coryphaenoides rupestris]|nr:hypothetical protein CRUP_037896 [Coryphaenoides rupestris]